MKTERRIRGKEIDRFLRSKAYHNSIKASHSMSIALNGWHPGERSIQERLNFAGPMAMAYTWIDSSMPEQHRTFHTRNLPFVPITTLDSDGRPWSSIAAGRSGLPGFISSPNETELDVGVKIVAWGSDGG